MGKPVDDITTTKLADIRERVANTASLLSGRKSIKTELSDKWAADLDQSKILWRPDEPFTNGEIITDDSMLYLIGHEAGHLEHTGNYKVRCRYNDHTKQTFHMFVNASEDLRMERKVANEFPGFKPLADRAHGLAYDFHFDKADAYPLDVQVVLNFMAEENGDSRVGQFGSQQAQDLYKKLSQQFKAAVNNSATTQELAKNVKPVFDEIRKHLPPDHPDHPNQDTKSESDASGRGAGGSGVASEGVGELANRVRQEGWENAEKQAEAEAQGKGKGQDGEDGDKNQSGSGGVEWGLGDRQMDVAESLADYAKEQYEAGQKVRSAEVQAKSFDTASDPSQATHFNAVDGDWDRSAETYRAASNMLSKQLRAKLQTNAADYWENGLKRGRLNTRSAHKVNTGNYRIFRQRHQIGRIDYTIGLMVDVSGSMDHLAHRMSGVTTMLIEALDKAGIGYFLIPWDNRVWPGIDYGQTIKDKRLADKSIFLIRRPNGGTMEIVGLLKAEKEFKKVPPGSRKILICVTDGSTSAINESKEKLEQLKKQGVITLGIGLAMAPPAHYAEGLEVRDPSELVDALPRFLNKIIRKGH